MLLNHMRRFSAVVAHAAIGSILVGGALLAAPAVAAPSFETTARNAILIEQDTGMVLYEKMPDERIRPASMSKLMTAYVVFGQLQAGALKLTDTLPVSVDIWRKWRKLDGSTMFLNANDRPTVDELLQGVIVQSGNDACDVLAENLGGSEEGFADWMNRKAKEIGLTGSTFRNASGYPDPDHWMTVRDIATVGGRIIVDFPDYYHYYSQRSFTYAGVKQNNRNPILYSMEGADGMKTGYTAEAGYGVAVSAMRDGRRLIAVIAGLPSVRERAKEAERILNYGFRSFKTYKLFEKGQMVEEAAVWLGQHETIPLVAATDIKVTLDRVARQDMKVKVVYDGPIAAPIAEGQEVGKLIVTVPDRETIEVPLLAGTAAKKLTGFGRIGAAISQLIWGQPAAQPMVEAAAAE